MLGAAAFWDKRHDKDLRRCLATGGQMLFVHLEAIAGKSIEALAPRKLVATV